MMVNKKLIFAILLIVLMIGISACGTEKPVVEPPVVEEPVVEEPVVVELEYTDDGIIKPEIAEAVINEISDELMIAIKEKDFDTISAFTHPDKGVRFTPYTYISLENDIVLNKAEIEEFFEVENVYMWGFYDGIGTEIELTPAEYYEKFIYTEDFLNAEQVSYNEILRIGNMLENQFEVYEDAIIVEYYFPGFNPEYEGMDWQSLRLVFQQYDGTWLLVGIIHNQWTI